MRGCSEKICSGSQEGGNGKGGKGEGGENGTSRRSPMSLDDRFSFLSFLFLLLGSRSSRKGGRGFRATECQPLLLIKITCTDVHRCCQSDLRLFSFCTSKNQIPSYFLHHPMCFLFTQKDWVGLEWKAGQRGEVKKSEMRARQPSLKATLPRSDKRKRRALIRNAQA